MNTKHNVLRSLLAQLATLQLLICIPTAAFAVDSSPAPLPSARVVTAPVAPRTPINLDLTSTTRSLPAPQFVQKSPVNILVGGAASLVTASSLLTPGERLAAYQVLFTGQQSILLGAQGNAVGGSFNIGPRFSQYVSNLTVPQGVTAIQNAASAGTLSLVGNLTNAGTFYAVSTNPAFTTASISALNITNQQGAVLTSVLPTGGLPGFHGALANLNLSLNALNNIINSGTISSSSGLSIYAGGTITNALPAGIAGPGPTLMALNQLTMQASSIVNAGQILAQQGALNVYTPNLTNSGMMQSLLSNLSVQNLTGNTLSVTNTMGRMQALGSIDFRTLATNSLGKAALNVTGGTLAAQTVNLVSPDGIIHVNGETISGSINVSGGEAVVGVNQGNLSITSLNLTGDPVIYNTNGNVTIDLSMFTAAMTAPGEDWTFLAGGNILGGAGTFGHTFYTGTGTNGNLTLASGVTFIPTGGVGTVTVPGPTVPFTISGASATGGNIELLGINLLTNGRNVSLQAHGGSANTGTIQIGNITSSGVGARPAGVILIAADGSITEGRLTSIGGTGLNGGTISVATPQTISSDSIISAGGAGGMGLAGGLGGDLSFTGSGSSTVTGTITSQGGDGGAGSPGGGAGGAGGTGGDISLAFGGNIGGQQVLSRGGDGGKGGDGGPGIPGGAGGGGGTGGNISLAAGGNITTLATLSIGGNGGAGGKGDPGGPGGKAGTGGDISMVAHNDVLADTVISFGGLGGAGGMGDTPFAGGQGGIGGGGGTGGNISLTSSHNDINVCQVISFGGLGGAGATGHSGTAGGQGGAGGLGGVGGDISLTAFRDSVALEIVSIGGDGGLGAIGNAGSAGGNGGAGGKGGTSGNIAITAGRSSTTDDVVTLGGFGGIGGAGLSVGAGGAGGAGGGAGTGGNISVTTTSLDIVGNNFISTGGVGGAGGNGHSGAANGTGGTGGGGGVGGSISLTAGRDAIACCVISTGGIGGIGGSGQSIGEGGAGGAAGGGGRGGDLSVTTGRDSLVDKLITIGGAGGAGGTGGAGDPGGVGGLGGRGGDISVTAAGIIFRDIITSTGGLGGAPGLGTPPGVAGGTGIAGTISLTTPNPVIDFVAPNCVDCVQLGGGVIQSTFRQQIMNALTANTVIECCNLKIQTQLCEVPPVPPIPPVPPTSPITNQTTGGSGGTGGPAAASLSTQLLTGSATIVGDQCLAYYLYDMKESFLQATQGTQLQVAGAGEVKVSNGQVVVKTGNEKLTLMPASARVTLKPHAVASIESHPGQPTTIVALDALGEDGVTVQVGNGFYALHPGEQIMITQRPTKEQLAQDIQTVETAGSAQDHVYVLRASVNLPEFIPKMAFLECRTCAFRHYIESKFQEDGHVALTEAPYADISINSPTNSTGRKSTISNNPRQFADGMKPIGFVEIAPGMPGVASATKDPDGFILGSKTTIERVGVDHYKLESGNLLLQPQNSTRIDTSHGQLFVKSGAIVLMAAGRHITRVRNMHDNYANDIVFVVAGLTVNLTEGREVTITDSTNEALPRVYEDGMSRRGVNLTKHAGLQVVTADFSILNAFMLQPLLLELRRSKASNDIRMTNTILKTAAAISLVFDRYKGPYYAPVIMPGTGLAGRPNEMTYNRPQ